MEQLTVESKVPVYSRLEPFTSKLKENPDSAISVDSTDVQKRPNLRPRQTVNSNKPERWCP